jgi:hypothetical protein
LNRYHHPASMRGCGKGWPKNCTVLTFVRINEKLAVHTAIGVFS